MIVNAGFEHESPQLSPIALLESFTDADEVMDTVLSTTYNDSDELVSAMEVVGELLPKWDLDHLKAFNTAYLSLSRDVGDAVKGRSDKFSFSHPDIVEQTMGIFAELYFRQIRAHHNVGPKGVDEAWRPLFYSDAGRKGSPGIQFLLGMNAHIVYDLPQALMKSGVNQDYYDDYTQVVGGLIDEVARQLAPAYVPGTSKMRTFLTGQTVLRIADWREDAWHAGRRLQAIKGRYEKDGDGTGDWLSGVPRGRVATKGIMRECKRNALRNARVIGLAGRAALIGVASIGGRPPVNVADIADYRAKATERLAA